MIELYIRNQLCDAPAGGLETSFTYSIKNAQESGSIRGVASYTVKLPASPRNNQIFGTYWNLGASDFTILQPKLFKADDFNECQLKINGDLVFNGKCRLIEFSSEEYQLQLLGANLTWGTVFQNRKLREVDLDATNWRYDRWRYYNDICTYDKALNYYHGFVSPQFDSDFAMSALTLDELHLQFQTFAFPIVNYGDTLDLDGVNQPMIEFYKIQASAFIAPLLFAHFAQLGYKLESRFFRNDIDGKSLALLYTSQNVPSLILAELSAEPPVNDNGAAFGPGPGNFLQNYVFTDIITENYDSVTGLLFTVANQASYASYSPVPYAWEFETSFRVQRTGSAVDLTASGTWEVKVYKNNVTLLATYTLSLGSLTTATQNSFATVALSGVEPLVNGDFINVVIDVNYTTSVAPPVTAQIDWIELQDGYFKAQPDNMEGIITDLREGLPDITVADLLKDLVSMFNLWVYTDEKLNTVYIETYDEFFKDISKDISLAIDRSDAIGQRKYSSEFARNLYFRFAEDSGDALLESYKNRTGTDFGTGQLINADKTTRDDNSIETEHLSATLNGPWDDALFPAFRVPYLLGELNQTDYLTGEFNPRIVRIGAPLSATTAAVGASYLKINFTVNPQGPVCAGPIGFSGAPTWTSFMTSPTTGTITYKYYSHAFFFDAAVNQQLLNLPFNRIPKFNDVYSQAEAQGLIQRYYANWWQHVQSGRLISLRILLHRLTIDSLTDFRELLWIDGHVCILNEIKNYRPGSSQIVESTLLMIR